jgi:EpsI family protein
MMGGLLTRGKYEPGLNESNFKDFPLNHRGWIGERITMDQKVYDILETNALVLSRYVKEGKSVVLAIVYYPDAKVSFHEPELCYGGRGVKINKEVQKINVKELGVMNVNVLTIDRGNSKELVYYFYKSGEFMGNSYNKMRFNLVKNNLLSKERGGALIRISTAIIDDKDAGQTNLFLFLKDFIPAFKTYM